MLDIKHIGYLSDVHIIDIYNIIDIYDKSFCVNMKGHDNCLCKKLFKQSSKTNMNNKKIEKLTIYLNDFYNKIPNIQKNIQYIQENHENISWNINHDCNYNGSSKNFSIFKKFKIIGYNEKNVFIIYVKPQFSNLNYNEILMNSIYDTFLIKNIEKYKNQDLSENYKKYDDKEIKIFVCTLDREEPFEIKWNFDEDNIKLINDSIYNYLIDSYQQDNNKIYYFYYHYKDKYEKKSDKPAYIIEKII